MMEHLTNTREVEDARRRIRELIDAREEWFYSQGATGVPISLRKGELDFSVSQGRLIFSCWSERGAMMWRVIAWGWSEGKLLLEATRRTGAERAMLELVPRASASAAAAIVAAARRQRAERLAQLARATAQGAKVERIGLSLGARRGQPGRYARILLRLPFERIAVSGIVTESDTCDVDAFLSSALIWFTRASESARRSPYIKKLWLVVQNDCVEAMIERLALLRDSLRRAITLYGIAEDCQELMPAQQLTLRDLWTKHPARFRSPPPMVKTDEAAARIVALAPEAIDVIHARHGETLRFHGLPFARVRRVMNETRIWFGIEGARRRLLDEDTKAEWSELLRELKEHRSAGADDHQHAFYRALPEAWLESLLRRDITRLDPGLRLAPLHAQFRASQVASAGARRPIDLLALRRDGRLVVIELKVSEDREHVLQGADYWRQVEAHRRRGHIARSRLFDNAVIADQPPLVYLVAPTLRFHRSFQTLARAISPEIEIYRFDINEDWRTGVRVMRRSTLHI
jgi:hypothetical protein